jgi:Phage integrase family
VFPAETGDGFYQSTRKVWAEVIKMAKLPGVTPHTLRHTLGSTATSSGEALALTGATLGHANLRSTAIYAYVQRDPSLEGARRVEKLLATALEGKAAQSKDGDSDDNVPELDADLIRMLGERLSKEGSDAARPRAIIAQWSRSTREFPLAVNRHRTRTPRQSTSTRSYVCGIIIPCGPNWRLPGPHWFSSLFCYFRELAELQLGFHFSADSQ